AGAWFQGRVILAWRVEKGKVEVFSISGADMAATAGADAHFMLQLVMFALQTGQVFPVSQGRVSKEQVQQLLAALIGQVARATPARLAPAARAELLAQAKGLSAHKFLMAMLKKGLVGAQRVQWAGHIGPALDRLGEKLGEQLGEFLRNPGHERYKPIVQGLTEAERQAITILQRVARAQ
ncbi:MAG: hypothetical protein HY423_03190, partial [Candidatus Lambdaproteobacteria bacterium]|nr:hypothetical protein [Candidatus Lambdaproteobacteria bacterium]